MCITNLHKDRTGSICHYFLVGCYFPICLFFSGVTVCIKGEAFEDPHFGIETSRSKKNAPNPLPQAVKDARKRRNKQQICSTGNGQETSQSAAQPFHGCTAVVNSGHLSHVDGNRLAQ